MNLTESTRGRPPRFLVARFIAIVYMKLCLAAMAKRTGAGVGATVLARNMRQAMSQAKEGSAPAHETRKLTAGAVQHIADRCLERILRCARLEADFLLTRTPAGTGPAGVRMH